MKGVKPPQPQPRVRNRTPKPASNKRTTLLPTDTKPSNEAREKFHKAKQKLYEYWKD